MARSKSSDQWLKEHFSDEYVLKAKKDGYRSRAAYKLIEIQEKDKLIKPGMTVIDLGAAPGGWSQLAADYVGHNGRVIALDILPMDSLAGVEVIQGDFREDDVLEKLIAVLGNDEVDLVISDMAPNMTGNKAVDIPKAMYLIELAFELSHRVLKKDGDMLCKIFHGSGFDELLLQAKQAFTKIVMRKPKASRDRSRESYLLAKGYKL